MLRRSGNNILGIAENMFYHQQKGLWKLESPKLISLKFATKN